MLTLAGTSPMECLTADFVPFVTVGKAKKALSIRCSLDLNRSAGADARMGESEPRHVLVRTLAGALQRIVPVRGELVEEVLRWWIEKS